VSKVTKILVWNVRGLNSSSRQDVVRTLLQVSRSDIVCFQETKMSVVPQRVLLSMFGSDFSSFIELPANGSSGGIVVAWRQCLGIIGEQRIDNKSVLVQFCPAEGQEWWLTCVWTTRK
jgi:exonuclease III